MAALAPLAYIDENRIGSFASSTSDIEDDVGTLFRSDGIAAATWGSGAVESVGCSGGKFNERVGCRQGHDGVAEGPQLVHAWGNPMR